MAGREIARCLLLEQQPSFVPQTVNMFLKKFATASKPLGDSTRTDYSTDASVIGASILTGSLTFLVNFSFSLSAFFFLRSSDRLDLEASLLDSSRLIFCIRGTLFLRMPLRGRGESQLLSAIDLSRTFSISVMSRKMTDFFWL